MKAASRIALALAAVLFAAFPARAAVLVIQDNNAAGQGFNDPTPATPLGLNFGTTNGQQAVILFQYAAAIWGATLRGSVPIVIDAAYVTPAQDSDFTCTATSALLGYTRAVSYVTGTPLPNPNAAYVVALANTLVGSDQSPGQAHIRARFNSGIGTANCLPNASWYLGLDDNIPSGKDSLLATLLHEFGHGLGFASTVDPTDGSLTNLASVFDFHVYDETAGVNWAGYQASQRNPLIVGLDKLAFDGTNVAAGIGLFLGDGPVLDFTSAGVTAETDFLPGEFSAPIPDAGTYPVAAAVPLDACSDLVSGSLTGQIGLIERGTCAFYDKAARAVAAGAAGVVIFDQDAGPLIIMAETDGGTLDVPAVFISNQDGTSVLNHLDGGTVTGSFASSGHLSNTDPSQTRVLLYTPATVSPGSTVSHWNAPSGDSFPKTLLMEPFINASQRLNLDLTPAALADLGWPVVNGLSVGMSKALDASLADGAQATYILAIVNRRTTPVDNVSMTLSLPAGASFVSATGGCAAFPCALGTVAAGEVRPVLVTVQAAKPTIYPFVVTANLSAPGTNSDDNLTASISADKVSPPSGGCSTAGAPAAVVTLLMLGAAIAARRRKISSTKPE